MHKVFKVFIKSTGGNVGHLFKIYLRRNAKTTKCNFGHYIIHCNNLHNMGGRFYNFIMDASKSPVLIAFDIRFTEND